MRAPAIAGTASAYSHGLGDAHDADAALTIGDIGMQAGGIPMLKALGGPFPDVAFCPTGGISVETAPQYLALPNVKVCGGSWLTPADAVAAKDWARITRLAQEAGKLR